MKGFKLNSQGDIDIKDGNIQMAYDADLTMQTIKSVWGTQKGEWFLNIDEGINRKDIMGKNDATTDEYRESVRAELNGGLDQVDENLDIDTLTIDYDKTTRKVTANVTMVNSGTDEKINVREEWG